MQGKENYHRGQVRSGSVGRRGGEESERNQPVPKGDRTHTSKQLDASLRQGRWDSQWAVGVPMPPPHPELAGKTLGILGFGHIGEALARRARAFDMQVCAIRRQAQSDVPEGVSFIAGPERLD